MTLPSDSLGMIHPSVYNNATSLLNGVEATPRPHGALRYRCPVSNSVVCLTDDAMLAALDRPRARTPCPSCGEVHLLMLDREAGAAPIVAVSSAP